MKKDNISEYILNDNYELKNIKEKCVLIRKNSNCTEKDLILLNHTGQLLIQNLSRPSSLDELVENIATNYKVDKEIIKEDVESFINKMVAHDIINLI